MWFDIELIRLMTKPWQDCFSNCSLEDYDVRVHPCSLTNNELEPLGGSHRSSAQFFVAVGVLTFLYCLGALLQYIFLDKLYRTRENIPLTVSVLE